jgi:hypothetical protein
MKEFAPILRPPNYQNDDKIESISIDSNGSKSEPTKKPPKVGSAAADPILVESDIEDFKSSEPDLFSLRTFEVKQSTSLEDALSSLQAASAFPSESETSEVSFLRRSSRKRKSRYPSGNLLRENAVNVGLHHNMAALRLLLYEKCEVSLSGRRLTLVMSINDGKAHQTFDINFESGQRHLQEVIDGMRGEAEKKHDSNFEPSKDLLLLYQNEEGGGLQGLHETMMDSLLQMANLEPPDSSDQSANSKKRRRNRQSERGFQGTLLQSSAAVENSQNEEDVKEDQVKLDRSAVSDEEKVNAIAAEEPVAKTRVILSDSSDDEVLRSPFSKKPRQARLDASHVIASESKVIVETESSEDGDQVSDDRAQTPISNISEDVVPKESPPQESTELSSSDDQLRKVVFDTLLTIVDQPADKSNCWLATNWAIDSNSTEKSEAVLLDIALAKYIDNQ